MRKRITLSKLASRSASLLLGEAVPFHVFSISNLATRLEAGSRTQFARALGKYTKYKGYDTFEEAMVAYEALVAAKTLRVKPIRGGRFDSRLTLPPFPEC